jgi:hypothetical protein
MMTFDGTGTVSAGAMGFAHAARMATDATAMSLNVLIAVFMPSTLR